MNMTVMTRHTILGILALGSLSTVQAQAQQQTAQSKPAPPAPAIAEEESWEMRHSHVIVGAERLSNVGGYRYNVSQDGREVGRVSASEASLLYSGHGTPRVSFDFAWLGTIGGTVGYGVRSAKVETFELDITQTTKVATLLVGLRGGVLLGGGRFFSAWLRAGYQYQRDLLTAEGEPTDRVAIHSLVFDPRFVITIAPHVVLSVGPYVQFDTGEQKTKAPNQPGAYVPLTFNGSQGGLSLDIYAFIGG
jgi:hypothetical protein